MRFTHLNAEPKPLDGEDPPSGLINPDYKQQPSNPRKCVTCGKRHDMVVECQKTGERLSEIPECYDCFFSKAFKYQLYDKIVKLKESVTE